MVSFRVLDIDVDRRGISHISDSALLRRDLVGDTVFHDQGHSYPDVSELEVELTEVFTIRISVCSDERVCPDNLLDLTVDEVVERIDVLLDQTSDSEEGRDQFPFILNSRDDNKWELTWISLRGLFTWLAL